MRSGRVGDERTGEVELCECANALRLPVVTVCLNTLLSPWRRGKKRVPMLHKETTVISIQDSCHHKEHLLHQVT